MSGGPIADAQTNVNPGNDAALVHHKDRRRSPAVIEAIVDAIGTADRVIGIGQDRVGIVKVVDQGLHPRLGLYHQGDNFGVLFLELRIAGLQLAELRATGPSTSSAEKDYDHLSLVAIVAQADRLALGVDQRKIRCQLVHG